MLFNPLPHNLEGEKKHFENIVGKGENVDNQHFLLFPQCFLLHVFQGKIAPFEPH